MSKKIIYFNPTPKKYSKRNIGNCTVRSVSIALGKPYEEVAKKLKYTFNPDEDEESTDVGVAMEKIEKTYNRYCSDIYDKYDLQEEMDKIQGDMMNDREFMDGYSFDLDDEMRNDDKDISLVEFMDIYAGQGVFVVGLVDPENKEDSGHTTCVIAGSKDQTIIDTWNCSKWLVDSYLWIKDEHVNPVLKNGPSRDSLDKQFFGKTLMESIAPYLKPREFERGY